MIHLAYAKLAIFKVDNGNYFYILTAHSNSVIIYKIRIDNTTKKLYSNIRTKRLYTF